MDIKAEIKETTLTDDVLNRLIELSLDWEKEESCFGYRANGRSDIEGNRIFTAVFDGKMIGYLFGKISASKNMTSIMPENTAYFEVEEIYVMPDFRSKGIGSELFSFASEKVKADAEFIMLSTATKNWRAVFHFYLDELGMELWSARLFKKIR